MNNATEDIYRLALQLVHRHLEAAAVPHSIDDGDLCFRGHRIGLSITFGNFAEQSGEFIAPVEFQMHVDGDDGSKFHVGTLGHGKTEELAVKSALEEWHLLTLAPVLAALGAPAGSLKREGPTVRWQDWTVFAGRAGLRGTLPPGLASGGTFFRLLMNEIRSYIANWPTPAEFTLRSIFLMYSAAGETPELQAAVDGYLDEALTERLTKLEWPQSPEPYLYKQMFIFATGQP
ncbi:MAG: DUF6348 family protein [Planctomycetota bacterium]|nr:DUF6348 family protein [Planctomycetota bacterium]